MSNSFHLPKIIYLFGHRAAHGKDTVCDIFQEILRNKNISFYRTMFAKMLKKQAADRYGLDLVKMEQQEYKMSIVPHAKPKTVYINDTGEEVPTWVFMDPGKLKITQKEMPRTVREILIEEGRFARSIWEDTWTWQAYNEVFNSGAEIGFISDWRYPNESNVDKMFNLFTEKNSTKNFIKPKLVRVQVYRPDGIFKNDGADAELPDDFDFYDYNIMNETRSDWLENLKRQVEDILFKTYEG